MKTVYTFHSATGEYIGEGDALVDTLTGDQLLPPNGTFTPPPPPPKSDHVPVYPAGQWDYSQDHPREWVIDLISKQFRAVSQLGPLAPGHVAVGTDTMLDYTAHRDHYSVTDSAITQLSADEIVQLEPAKVKGEKMLERMDLFTAVDQRVMRQGDHALLNISQSDDPYALAAYRQYLGEFNHSPDSWMVPMLTYDEYRASRQHVAPQGDTSAQTDQEHP
jgi:hypothetical protein